ncbi:MAG: uroporphyrinogen-III C-methyltransferase [Burkholderiaceae bacterium]|nr:uroporphyrinogen-III C-methyltransferase [Burkholderiaceae bacterium]
MVARWAGWAALVLVAILAIYFLRWSERTGRELSRRVHEGEIKIAKWETELAQVRDLERDLQNRAAVAESKLAEVLGQQAQLELLYRAVTEDNIEAILADVETSVSMAGQQLAAGGNPQAALFALQSADQRLARGDDARVQGLRAAIGRDIERLRTASGGDSVTIAARLDSIVDSIDGLTLIAGNKRVPGERAAPLANAGDAGGAAPTQNWLRRMFSAGALGEELAQLVRVSRIDAPDAALVAPEQAYFLRENLRLLLLNARLTLVGRNDALFRSDLDRVIGWLGTYYDRGDRKVVATIEQLRQLKAARAATSIPTVSESLAAVRSARGARDSKR